MTAGVPHFFDDLPDHYPETPCRAYSELFVDSSRTTPLKGVVEDCKRICAGCPVRKACGDYAITHDERDGIWGGMTVDERDRLALYQAAFNQTTPEG